MTLEIIKPSIVILHCSATPDFQVTDPNFDKFSASDIDAWHKERGFKKIGYHWVIKRSGLIEQGRLSQQNGVEIGAHCKDQNHNSIGICYIGTKQPTQNQLSSIASLYHSIKSYYNISLPLWFGHNDFNPHKICPGFNISFVKKYIENY